MCRESRELVLEMYGSAPSSSSTSSSSDPNPNMNGNGNGNANQVSFLVPGPTDLMRKWWQDSRTAGKSNEKALAFLPDSDTIFFRSLDRPAGGLLSLCRNVRGFERIRHLALLLPKTGLPLKNEWRACIGALRDLKTLTYLVGGGDQRWGFEGKEVGDGVVGEGEGEIELRDVEEWFCDGRDRMVKVDGWTLDVQEVGRYLGGKCFESRMVEWAWSGCWEGINVRVVAWRKGS